MKLWTQLTLNNFKHWVDTYIWCKVEIFVCFFFFFFFFFLSWILWANVKTLNWKLKKKKKKKPFALSLYCIGVKIAKLHCKSLERMYKIVKLSSPANIDQHVYSMSLHKIYKIVRLSSHENIDLHDLDCIAGYFCTFRSLTANCKFKTLQKYCLHKKMCMNLKNTN